VSAANGRRSAVYEHHATVLSHATAQKRGLLPQAKTRHRLECPMAGDPRKLGGAWRVLSSHRQKNDTVETDTRVLKLHQGIAGRSKARTCHEEVDAADDAVRFKRPDLGK